MSWAYSHLLMLDRLSISMLHLLMRAGWRYALVSFKAGASYPAGQEPQQWYGLQPHTPHKLAVGYADHLPNALQSAQETQAVWSATWFGVQCRAARQQCLRH